MMNMAVGTAAFTIVAKNYLPYARVLMNSVAIHHPTWRRFVILVDEADGYFDPRWENFEVIPSSSLPCTAIEWVQFKYTILELSTALKPFGFDYIFHNHSVDQIIYLDPDIKLYSTLDKVTEALGSSHIALTPHLTARIHDEKYPTELSILRSGSFNLGFIAVSRSPTTDCFLKWWEEKLYDQCVVDLAAGLFVDQRWVDLVPGLFDGVTIIRDPGYNVAYWNLSHRLISCVEGHLRVNGSALAFFHFSGYDATDPSNLSRHQDRFVLEDLPSAARELVEAYGRDLISAGFLGCQHWPYTHATFHNGVAIPDLCRPVHHEQPALVSSITDPFSNVGFQAFVKVWNAPYLERFPGITKLAHRIYEGRVDVKLKMPDIFGRDYREFLEWMLQSARSEHKIAGVFLSPVNAALSDLEEVPPMEAQNQLFSGETTASGIRWTRIALAIYHSRADLQTCYPDPFDKDCIPFLMWFLTRGQAEHHLSWEQIAPMHDQFQNYVAAIPSAASRLTRRVTLTKKYYSAVLRSVGTRLSSVLRDPVAPQIPPLTVVPSLPIPDPASPAKPGVNLVGYLHTETGVGQSARGAFSAFQSLSIPVTLVSAGDSNPSRKNDSAVGPMMNDGEHLTNLFYVNADQTSVVRKLLGSAFYRKRINIGVWAWELDEFPDCWNTSFSPYHEIWTPSSFCCRAICRNSPIPVLCMPHAVSPFVPQGIGRDYFSIPSDRFVFLTALDVLSVVKRKDPFAAIKAFQSAFNGNQGFELIVKVNNGPAARGEVQSLRDAAAAVPGVRLLDSTLRREEMYALSRCTDCFVSLHRSEGFGLSIAEAMFFGKPVIVTNYSGNLDFTFPENSFLVDYKLVPVGEQCDPYPAGSLWAEASIEHAARRMVEVANNAEIRARKATAASGLIRQAFSPNTVGARMRDRLEALQSELQLQKTVHSPVDQGSSSASSALRALAVSTHENGDALSEHKFETSLTFRSL